MPTPSTKTYYYRLVRHLKEKKSLTVNEIRKELKESRTDLDDSHLYDPGQSDPTPDHPTPLVSPPDQSILPLWINVWRNTT